MNLMDFSLDRIGSANFLVGDFNAVTFSVYGMLLVFSGLVIISFYIVMLPKLLGALEGKSGQKPVERVDDAGEEKGTIEEKEVLVAIATAFYLDQNFPEENQKITWKSHGDVESPWQISGRVHGLSQRAQVGRRTCPRR